MNRMLTVLIASAFAASSGIAFTHVASGAAVGTDSTAGEKQQKREAFGDKERTLQEQSRSSASGPLTTGGDSAVDKPIRSGNQAKDFAEREKAFSKASRSSASGHNKVTKTPKLTHAERSAIQKEAATDWAGQSRR